MGHQPHPAALAPQSLHGYFAVQHRGDDVAVVGRVGLAHDAESIQPEQYGAGDYYLRAKGNVALKPYVLLRKAFDRTIASRAPRQPLKERFVQAGVFGNADQSVKVWEVTSTRLGCAEPAGVDVGAG
ncbi:hypothetical protein SATRM34S_00166 [Streptomyces atroolivaceus]